MTSPPPRTEPLLFSRFPKLKPRLPWTPLLAGPTPAAPLLNVSRRLGREVWIKRDDLTSPLYGGNKPRKLEFILAEAQAGGRTTLVTGGGIGTNHGLATAIFGRRLGLEVILLLFDQPLTAHVRRQLRLFHFHQARMVYCGLLPGFVARYYISERLKRPGAYFIEPGGSNVAGVLGYVEAALEMAGQIERGEMPEPADCYVAAGTCGTLAGLALGLKLAGLKTRVIGVKVATSLSANTGKALRLARRSLALLRSHDPSIPEVRLAAGDLAVDPDHYGPGYGHRTPECCAAFDLMAEAEGLTLDHTYTAKTFAALCRHCADASGPGPLLFINSFNSVDLSAQAEAVDYRRLPPAFHRFFKNESPEE
ncbi:MAG: pyridoxal-phosphate dependent enzyme [Thermodesulfobacteriota bacterium]